MRKIDLIYIIALIICILFGDLGLRFIAILSIIINFEHLKEIVTRMLK